MSHFPCSQPATRRPAMVSEDRSPEPDGLETWLQRDLARQHDDILTEPVPADLLRLLEDFA